MTDGQEDDRLLWQATARAEALLADLEEGRTPADELIALLDYLREVVLARITEEERVAFPALREAGLPDARIATLRQEHLVLREDIDDLAAAASSSGSHEPGELGSLTRRLIDRLEQHLRHEAGALADLPGSAEAGASAWVTAQHWFPLTEGPMIDMDLLRPDQVDDAVLNRLTHIRLGEPVRLRGHHDPAPLWHRLQRRAPGAYTWEVAGDAQQGWTVMVSRRAG